MFEFKLPDLGEGVHEGELLKWYVKKGDAVKEDDPLLDVETDKAAVTIPSPATGTVVEANGNVGDTLTVGQVIVVIDDGTGGDEVTAAPQKKPQKKAQKKAQQEQAEQERAAPEPANKEAAVTRAESSASPSREPAPAASVESNGAGAAMPARTGGPVPAAPATRRLARELGIELANVRATGPGGRVTMQDVKAFADGGAGFTATADGGGASATETAEAGEPLFVPSGDSSIPLLELEPMPDFASFGPVEVEALRSIRRKVAKKMVTSMVVVPHVCHMDDADVTDLEAMRKREKEKLPEGAKLSVMAFVVKAVTVCLKKYPAFNASLDPFKGQLVYKKYYNIGFAADTPKGLMVPVIRDADAKNMLEISDDIVKLAGEARDGTIAAEAFKGGTFTITNVGSLGGTGLIPTINYPEVAILGMGRTQERPVVRDGEIVVRKILPLTLAFDHRMADGADAARFMNDLTDMLSDPMSLLMKL